MFCRKYILFSVLIVIASALFAEVGTETLSLAEEAQAKADRISDIEGELKQIASEAASSGDSKLKVCVEKYSGTVKGLVKSANEVVLQVLLFVTLGKSAEAQNQMNALNALADSADAAHSKALNCEKSDDVRKIANAGEFHKNQQNGVSDAMNLGVGSDLPTEINRGAVKGSDLTDAAGVDSSDIQHSENENFEDIIFSGEDPQDIEKPVEEEEIIEEQSPTE
ncbi:hypothetical protein J6Z19_06815 [bacterium]|nr:hypothetical protein [bacterium]